MKKVLLLVMILTTTIFVFGNGQSEEKESESQAGMKVGMTVQDLSNQVWAARCVALEKVVTENGGQYTYMGCDSNVTTQIDQIENFVASGVDVLMVHPAEKNAINAALASVKGTGIKVFCYDEDIENADVCFLLDNYDAGYMIGTTAAEWINEKLGGEAEVAVLDYPQIEILLERGNGIVAAISDLAPNAEIVAKSAAINPTEGMAKTETFFQANPGIKVIACIGGGSAVGANEAVKAAGKLTDDFGIFASDATPQEIEAMSKNEAIRSSIMYTGTPEESAVIIYGWIEKMYKGEPIDSKVYHKFIPVNTENYKKYM